MIRLLLSLLFILSAASLAAQPAAPRPASPPPAPAPPKRELRAVWVATVRHLDYPATPTPDTALLCREYRELAARYRELGLNAVVFQVRAAADAFYPSALVPWSADLTGRQGMPPAGGFDPLAYFIEEAHRQGQEFHAWLNPYRATLDLDTLRLDPGHVFHRHRDWLVRYGDRFYLNPALPEVRAHLTDVVAELVERYDLDAIHFDDYFYPYKIPGQTFPDSLDFRRHGAGFTDIDEWRRHNTDELISAVSRRIKLLRPHVRFGISPFGVWRNAERDSTGSPTRAGAASYDDLYADILKWLRFGWIDYVAPQLYWSIGFPPADHQKLLDWWNRHRHGRQLYAGYAAYKVGNNPDSAWLAPAELPRQVDLGRARAIQGGIFFRSRFLLDNPLGVTDSLRQRYATPALIPEFTGPARARPAAPERLLVRRRRGEVLLRWSPHPDQADRPAAYYVIYRFDAREGGQFDNPAHILHVTPFGQHAATHQYTDRRVERRRRYTYAVSAVNRYHAESHPGIPRTVRAK